MWHDSFICGTTHSCVIYRCLHSSKCLRTRVRCIHYWYVIWLIHVMWLSIIHTCAMTPSYMSHDLFIYVPWLLDIRVMTPSDACTAARTLRRMCSECTIDTWHDSFTWFKSSLYARLDMWHDSLYASCITLVMLHITWVMSHIIRVWLNSSTRDKTHSNVTYRYLHGGDCRRDCRRSLKL